MPPRDKFTYTFDNIARVIGRFTEVIGFNQFAMYVFDYRAPTGFRIAMQHPERITAIISQNGNAYEEGLSPVGIHLRVLAGAVGGQPCGPSRFLVPETTIWQYTHGVPDASTISPDGYSLDEFYLTRPGADEVQLDLFRDYASNVALYPAFQDYFRKQRPRFLAVWARTIRFSSRPAKKRFSATSPMRRSTSSTRGTSRLETHAEPGSVLL